MSVQFSYVALCTPLDEKQAFTQHYQLALQCPCIKCTDNPSAIKATVLVGYINQSHYQYNGVSACYGLLHHQSACT